MVSQADRRIGGLQRVAGGGTRSPRRPQPSDHRSRSNSVRVSNRGRTRLCRSNSLPSRAPRFSRRRSARSARSRQTLLGVALAPLEESWRDSARGASRAPSARRRLGDLPSRESPDRRPTRGSLVERDHSRIHRLRLPLAHAADATRVADHALREAASVFREL